jgi:hypothetical protein
MLHQRYFWSVDSNDFHLKKKTVLIRNIRNPRSMDSLILTLSIFRFIRQFI